MAGGRTKPVILGVITGVHGIRGEVRVKSFTGDPDAIWSYGPLLLGETGKTVEVLRFRSSKGGFVVALEGVNDRNAAEKLKGAELKIDRDALPPVEPGEYYHEDLAGLCVRTVDGREVGTIVRVENFGAGDLLEVRLAGKKETQFLPFGASSVPEVNIEDGFVVVDPPEGLLDL